MPDCTDLPPDAGTLTISRPSMRAVRILSHKIKDMEDVRRLFSLLDKLNLTFIGDVADHALSVCPWLVEEVRTNHAE